MIIPGFSAYSITEGGVVTHFETGKIIKHRNVSLNKHYYTRVNLVGDDGKRHDCNVLRLLALAFLGTPDHSCIARAKDGNSMNTTLQNVEWVSYTANATLAWKSGKMSSRRPRPNTCCTAESMSMILNALEQLTEPVTTAELSRILDVPYSTVRYTITSLVQQGKVKTISGKGHIIA